MESIRWCKIDPDGPGLSEPQKEGDVGYDIAAAADVIIKPGVAVDVPCNIRIEIPKGHWAEIRARSSIARRNLQVDAGTIDNGYRGPIYALVRNMNSPVWITSNEQLRPAVHADVKIEKGERVAQIVFHQICVPTFRTIGMIEVPEISEETARGITGFGSTGTHV